MKSTVLCILVVLGGVAANWKCRPPQVWEGQFQVYMPALNVSVPYGRLSLDGENKRMFARELISMNGTTTSYLIYYYQPCRIMLVFNQATKKCQRLRVDMPFPDMAIPPNATFLGDAYVGSAGFQYGGLLVQTWQGKLDKRPQAPFSMYHTSASYKSQFYTTYTRHGCLPINFIQITENHGVLVNNFFDLTLGITDPNQFRPPRECYDQGLVMPEEEMFINRAVRPAAAEKSRYRLRSKLRNGAFTRL